jgi:microcystin-dependent protein
VAGTSLVDPNDLGGSLQSLADRVTVLEQTSIVPVGIVAYCAGVVPNGWLLLDGSTISATRYGQLCAYLGTTVLPDGGSKVIVGLDTAGTFIVNLATGGVETVVLTGAQSGTSAHGHGVTDPGHFHAVDESSYTGAGNSIAVGASPSAFPANSSVTSKVTGLTVNNSVAANASAAHTNLQPYIVMRPIIKF